MTAADRLNELLAESQPGLDRVLAVVASIDAAAQPTEAAVVARIDELAADCPDDPDAAAVLHHVYGTLGFVGDVKDYYDPSNSLIHRAILRRRGIPLTLGAIAVEVARRRDLELCLVGMPGHVLLGEGREPNRWYDPFSGGAELGYEDCRRLFAQFHPIAAFNPAMLGAMTAEAVAIRTLNNLRNAYTQRGNAAQVVSVLELRADMDSAEPGDRIELARLLTNLGRYDRAAEEFNRLAEQDPSNAEAYLARATANRAHRN